MLGGDSPGVAVRYAEVFARLMAGLSGVTVEPPLPSPRWARWDHTDAGVWPAIDFLDDRDQSVVPNYVADTAERVRGRILAAGLPCVLGHADFEAQNLRWHGEQVWAVHDWDSLAWQPEAALVGAASGTFPKTGPGHAGADREFRGVPGGLPGGSGTLVHGRGARGRVGSQLVDGSTRRAMGSLARQHPGVRAPNASGRAPPPGERLTPTPTNPPGDRESVDSQPQLWTTARGSPDFHATGRGRQFRPVAWKSVDVPMSCGQPPGGPPVFQPIEGVRLFALPKANLWTYPRVVDSRPGAPRIPRYRLSLTFPARALASVDS